MTNLLSRSAKIAAGLGTSVIAYDYLTDTRCPLHKRVTLPLTRLFLDGEDSHKAAIWASRWIRFKDKPDDKCLETTIFGRKINNCIGLAAGFDKNAEVIDSMFSMGFGIVEVGSITPLPQLGNPKPRVFRVPQDEAIINRYGFNSDGALEVLQRVQKYQKREGQLLGINLGKNKASKGNGDYLVGIKIFGEYADYLVVNVSSPNTPGLRDMQYGAELRSLLSQVRREVDQLENSPPLLVKIAPDLTTEEIKQIGQVILEERIDGVIVSNTTISRPSQQGSYKETGGLSGKPLHALSVQAVRSMYEATQGKVTIIGCGGVSSGEDALRMILSGASAVQLYTSLAYQGPELVRNIKNYLIEECRKRSIESIQELVGKGK